MSKGGILALNKEPWEGYCDWHYDTYAELLDEFAANVVSPDAQDFPQGWGMYFYRKQCPALPEGKRIAMSLAIEDEDDESSSIVDISFSIQWIRNYLDDKIRYWIKEAENTASGEVPAHMVAIFAAIWYDFFQYDWKPSSTDSTEEENSP